MSVSFYGKAYRYQSEIIGQAIEPTSDSLTTAMILQGRFEAGGFAWIGPRKTEATLPTHEERAGTYEKSETWDAYEICTEHDESAKTHRGRIGFAAYRFEIAEAARGSLLNDLILRVSGDPYLPQGARIAIATGTNAVPATGFAAIREGAAYVSGVAPRTVSGSRWYGTTALAVTITPGAALTLQRYLWVYVSLEYYNRSRNGWLEGGACLVGNATLNLDAAPTGFSAGDTITVFSDSDETDVATLATAGVSAWPMIRARKTIIAGTTPTTEYRMTGDGIVTFLRDARIGATASQTNTAWARAMLSIFPGYVSGRNAETENWDSMNIVRRYNSATPAANTVQNQFGISIGLGALNVSGSTYASGAIATYYIVPLPSGGGTYSKITLTNTATAQTVTGAKLRLLAWAMPIGALNEAAINELAVRVAALATKHDFWTGDSATLSGSILGAASGTSSDGAAETYTATATLLGVSDKISSIAASAAIDISLIADVPENCLLILAPQLSDVEDSVKLSVTVNSLMTPYIGFCQRNLLNSSQAQILMDGDGWLPGVTITK